VKNVFTETEDKPEDRALLIFGEPGVADGEAVIDLRKDLRLPPMPSSLITAHERASAES
jgi:hypothetical protein